MKNLMLLLILIFAMPAWSSNLQSVSSREVYQFLGLIPSDCQQSLHAGKSPRQNNNYQNNVDEEIDPFYIEPYVPTQNGYLPAYNDTNIGEGYFPSPDGSGGLEGPFSFTGKLYDDRGNYMPGKYDSGFRWPNQDRRDSPNYKDTDTSRDRGRGGDNGYGSGINGGDNIGSVYIGASTNWPGDEGDFIPYQQAKNWPGEGDDWVPYQQAKNWPGEGDDWVPYQQAKSNGYQNPLYDPRRRQVDYSDEDVEIDNSRSLRIPASPPIGHEKSSNINEMDISGTDIGNAEIDNTDVIVGNVYRFH
ncbi:MAG: hypothetical protein KDD58_00965 [Bdellovibrionales bacterium]|nr:hypothetical protein [Bdellovibrionales bacterium]